MNNYIYNNYDWNRNMNSNLNYYPYMNNSNMYEMFNPTEGFEKGNMFKGLYKQYKNYQPMTLVPNTEQEEALLNLNQMQFAMHELNLYLDIFPNDTEMLKKFTMYRNNYNKLLLEYEEKYEAININSNEINNTPFEWSTTLWPWNRRDL